MLVEDKPVVIEVPLVGEHLQSSKPEENVNSNTQIESQDGKPQVVTEVPPIEEHLESSKREENVNSNKQMECQDAKSQVENEGLKVEVETEDPKAELESGDGMHDFSSLNNQVPEVNLVSGFKVKSDSFSNDSMSINEKIELKDNINDENVKLSQDVVKLEMVVEPCSSTNVVPNNGESHPMDDDEQPLRNKASVDELDENNDTTADISNKDDSEEMGYSEKLNLDRSSSDDSMEEDLPETKQIDSNCSTDEIEDGVENEALIIEELESTVVAAVDGSSTEQKDIFVEKKSHCSGKRKFQDEEAIENNRPPKRQKPNSDNLQVPEQQATYLTTQLAASQSNFSSSDSTDSEDTPKEQDVTPSQKPPTTSLRVDNFLRPFTLKAVQQLLGKTGIITSFWMDHIKTHCYVTYSSVEEAIETRNALYNLQWPPNGGRLLVAEFVDPHEVETLTSQHQPSAHQQVSPEKRLPVPPPSPPSDEPDSPMVTLDDLFWKTKATPKIYYLPLSEEQVAAKQTTRERNNKNW
ncbi:ACINUS [Hibiscus trionum]|uniref:ACINUS n=1 Tax=Hibiscus trionum TaxID=183268 RepID=A0A9W7LL05_HIBTR|nr:ACINUS [Hibiscus trionum]